jgi:hypothetical protein
MRMDEATSPSARAVARGEPRSSTAENHSFANNSLAAWSAAVDCEFVNPRLIR